MTIFFLEPRVRRCTQPTGRDS